VLARLRRAARFRCPRTPRRPRRSLGRLLCVPLRPPLRSRGGAARPGHCAGPAAARWLLL